MRIGLVKPNFVNEKRVALLPKDITSRNEIFIEKGFGEFLDIPDKEYEKKGCKVCTRQEIYNECEVVFNLKLTQESDYKYLRDNQILIGWTHPTGSGREFYNEVAIPKNLIIVDLDNIYPQVFYKNQVHHIDWIPRNFVYKNSFNAGYASVVHALLAFGLIPSKEVKAAILASGNVSQGSYYALANTGASIRMFYRKTMNEFYNTISDYDIIVNGIEVDTPGHHIISLKDIDNIKDNALIIDAAADAGNAIEGSIYTSIDKPIYKKDTKYFYVVNNSPSVFYRTSSEDISESFSKYIFNADLSAFIDVVGRK